ncbi:MAG: protein-L-isoaspartate(D-aspartate) O-methyltransferase [Desulfobacula sp.]|nr:protein-L-isoaspartate(D-aspartate) O-methyltransferase [Desulfobacula sp.]
MIKVKTSFLIFLLLFSAPVNAESIRDLKAYADARKKMVLYQLKERGITDPKVMEAMTAVFRHEFVLPGDKKRAYYDRPLSIGYGQTISQPYIVALMTELLNLNQNSRVLEIGTGSGYQAAVLAHMVKEVFTIEIVKPLHTRSGIQLKKLGYKNIKTLNADGYYGWKDHAPFDGIIVTCASDFIPPPLIEQLKDGGLMCIPVGPPFKVQHLILVKKNKTEVSARVITSVRFVPLTRKEE